MFCVCPWPNVKVKSKIMHFLVNAPPSKRLIVATLKFADALVSSKRVFAMVYYRLKSSL